MVPCLLLALFVHPKTSHMFLFRWMWGFCVYTEAISVLPQLRMMQKAKVGKVAGSGWSQQQLARSWR